MVLAASYQVSPCTHSTRTSPKCPLVKAYVHSLPLSPNHLMFLPQYNYLSERRHDTYGFQYLALLFSLPKAMFLWSIALSVPQLLLVLHGSIGIIGLSAIAFFSIWFAVVFQYKLAPTSFRCLPSRNTSEGSHELASVV